MTTDVDEDTEKKQVRQLVGAHRQRQGDERRRITPSAAKAYEIKKVEFR